MRRPRHAKPSGLLARLFPGRTARREAARRQEVLLRRIADELRYLGAVAQAAADVAARQAAEAQATTAALHVEVARLHLELRSALWQARVPAGSAPDGLVEQRRVIDLREARRA